MNLLCMNCQGCGRPEKTHEINDLIKSYSLSLIFLSKTKLSATRAQDLRLKFGFANSCVVKCVGLSGGLVLFTGMVTHISKPKIL